jgi:hypothetical protein
MEGAEEDEERRRHEKIGKQKKRNTASFSPTLDQTATPPGPGCVPDESLRLGKIRNTVYTLLIKI